ncbi:MAG: zinc-finger protein [Chrysothrix sp. TS-e1954]|nr:MAG: zinc-finger protein [Chrysothrix sp. TS-e1954]
MGQNHWQSDHDFAQMLLQFNQEVPKQEPISRPTNYDRSGFSPFPLEQKPRLFTAPCTPRYPDIYCPTPDLTDSPSATPSSCFSADRPYQNMKVASSQVHTCLWCPDSLNPSAICGQTFCTAPDLHGHVEKAHLDSLAREDTLDNGFLCRWASCDRFLQRSFQARPKLKRHMQTHTLWKPFVCDVCGVQMKTKDAMDKHARTHTGERPYKCEEPGCDKIFATSTELKTHMVVHSGAKPHKCSLCNECFADSSNLSKHRKVHFVGAFRCPECGVRMKRWDQMRRHLVTQSHCLDLVNDPQRQQDYKMQMDQEFKSMPEALKTALPSGHPTLRHRHRA